MPNVFRNFVIGAIVIMLFSFSIIWFSLSIGTAYDKDISDLEGDKIDLSGINDTLNEASETADLWKNTFFNQSFGITQVFMSVVVMVRLSNDMWNFITEPLQIMFDMFTGVLAVPDIVVNIILVIIIISSLFALWTLIKAGS